MKKLLLTIILLIIPAGIGLNAQIPQLVSYQGVLKQNNQPVPPGTYTILFKLYATENATLDLWSESQNVEVKEGGLINTVMGLNRILTLPFDKPYWLGITIGAGNEMTPRRRLTSTPYSFRADTANVALAVIGGAIAGVSSINSRTGAIQLLPGANINISQNGNSFTIHAIGGGGSFALQASDSTIVVANGNGPLASVGLGKVPINRISQNGAANGQVLKWLSGSWTPANDSTSGYTAGTCINITGNTINHSNHQGDITGNLNIKVVALQGRPVMDSTPAAGQTLKWNNTNTRWEPGNDDNTTYTAGAGLNLTGTTFSAQNTGGDLLGAHTNAKVVKLQGRNVDTTTPGDGQVLRWNLGSSFWEPGNSAPTLPWIATTPNNIVADLQSTSQNIGSPTFRVKGRKTGGAVIRGQVENPGSDSTFAVEGMVDTDANGWAGKFSTQSPTGDGIYISTLVGQIGYVTIGGSKSAAVPTSSGARLLYCEEATEVLFSDYGFGQLVNGTVVINIDPVFKETVNMNEPYHVFIQLNSADCEGVAVINRTNSSFTVKELRNGISNAEFSYRIVAKRKFYERTRLERAPFADGDGNLSPLKK